MVYSGNPIGGDEENAVKVYQQIGDDWVLVGNIITDFDDGISSASLNADGNRLVLGSKTDGIGSGRQGIVRVYQLLGGIYGPNWVMT